ncbi:oxidoreductase [Mycobacterium sp. CBMA271]|uniref:PDR/VanB family oxidoreductase n=1 Tax=unclassified Mycobacteroides TaxID=2618759 RepID=UPI0012DC8685|nr:MULTISPECIES: PDR/VanB family oxidoreductase [unclassified Mycobacteroides]MUM18852.1 ferredoxin [Mycobacteroides sp. CBMA 326]MUM23208.1 oxidoreductase [Mycobacteroides sp. CBMA 271]
MTAGPQKLLVTQINREAADVLSVELRHPQGEELPSWGPGAHIDMHLPSGLIRQYSLCSDPADSTLYRVAVLRAAEGRGGSREVHDSNLTGRLLEIGGPRNHFSLKDAQRYLLIAGGIGVTPILAMARELTRRHKPWALIYGGRSRTSMAFVDELTALGGELELFPQDEHGIPDLDRVIGTCEPGTAVYCCGPEPMLTAVQALCTEHLASDALHVERFAAASTSAETLTDRDNEFEVELARSGQVLTVPADRTILDVVLGVLPGTAYSCREGVCGTCEVAVLHGTPDHRDDVLDDEERARGDTIMICISRANCLRLTLDL